MSIPAVENRILADLRQQLGSAMAAPKCHRCGCYQDTVQALETSSALPADLASQLAEAHALLKPKR